MKGRKTKLLVKRCLIGGVGGDLGGVGFHQIHLSHGCATRGFCQKYKFTKSFFWSHSSEQLTRVSIPLTSSTIQS